MASTKVINTVKVEPVVKNPEPTAENYNFVRPSHYVQADGRETWEHMLDIWTKEEVALWCEMTAYKYKDRIGRKPGETIEREQAKIDWYEKKAKELREVVPVVTTTDLPLTADATIMGKNSVEKKKFSFWK